jgi:hypothetical protein
MRASSTLAQRTAQGNIIVNHRNTLGRALGVLDYEGWLMDVQLPRKPMRKLYGLAQGNLRQANFAELWCDALWRGVLPARQCLPPESWRHLVKRIHEVLHRAIEHRNTLRNERTN